MIKAIIEHKNEGTVEIALPQSSRGMAEKLLSVGISKKPHDIRVSDTEKDDIRVRFTSDDTVGTHLIRLFNERCSLEDANETQLAIQNTPIDVQERINEKLLSDKYTSIKQIPENIKQWSYICDDDMDCLFTARLQCENESTYIHLPCDDLQKAAETINAPDIGSCDVRLTDFNIDCDEAVELFNDIFRKEGLQGVNTLAKATGGFDDYEFEKLIAAVEYAGVSDRGSICKLAESLDRIEVVDDVIDYEDLARYWIDNCQEYSLSTDLEDYFDFTAFGEDIARNHHGEFISNERFVYTDYGFNLKNILAETEPITKSFYFPLTLRMEEENSANLYEVDNRLLLSHQEELSAAIQKKQSREGNLAEYLNGFDELKDKLTSAEWTIEERNGEVYGKVDCKLRSPLVGDEEFALKSWIEGQNGDGFGEVFEQQPVTTDEGDMYVSFWHSGKDYFIHNQEEMDRYMGQQHCPKMGGM